MVRPYVLVFSIVISGILKQSPSKYMKFEIVLETVSDLSTAMEI